MRTDVKIGVVLGLLIIAGIVVYFSMNDGGGDADKPGGDKAGKKTPGDTKVKLPAFVSRTPRTPETPGVPTTPAEPPSDDTAPGTLVARTPEPDRSLIRPGASDVPSPGVTEPTTPTTPADATTPGTPGITLRDETTPAKPAPDTLTVGPPVKPADSDVAPKRPLFGAGPDEPVTVTPTTPKRPETPPETPRTPSDVVRTPAEPEDVIRVADTTPRRDDTIVVTPATPERSPASPWRRPADTESVVVAPAAAGTYTIQPGDKLWNIAEKVYGKGHLWTLISEANPSVDPSNLKVGTALKIPPAPRAAASVAAGDDVTDLAPGYQTYTVQRGEGFWKIAAKFYGNGALWTVIAEANPKLSPTAIREGRRIVIPPKPQPRIRADVTAEPVETRPGYRTYRVRAGDMLSTVSERVYGNAKHWPKIAEANPAADPRNLKVGAVLSIPPLGGGTGLLTSTRWSSTPGPEERTAPRRTRPAPPGTVPPGRPDFGP